MCDIRTHSQARASLGELVTHKLVYIYSNHVLHTRETVKLTDFSTLYLQPDESDALISALQDDTSYASLPASRADGGEESSDDSSSDEDERENIFGTENVPRKYFAK